MSRQRVRIGANVIGSLKARACGEAPDRTRAVVAARRDQCCSKGSVRRPVCLQEKLDSGTPVAQLHLIRWCNNADNDISGLLLDLGRVLCFNEELMDAAAAVNEDAPRREWTPEVVQSVAAIGRKLLLFAADKAGVHASPEFNALGTHSRAREKQDLTRTRRKGTNQHHIPAPGLAGLDPDATSVTNMDMSCPDFKASLSTRRP